MADFDYGLLVLDLLDLNMMRTEVIRIKARHCFEMVLRYVRHASTSDHPSSFGVISVGLGIHTECPRQ